MNMVVSLQTFLIFYRAGRITSMSSNLLTTAKIGVKSAIAFFSFKEGIESPKLTKTGLVSY